MDTRYAGSCWWHVWLDTPRSGVERRVWSPPPAMGRRRGGHPLCGVLLVACWVRHPTEWGGEESVVPPARDGQGARWTPLCGVLLMAACWVGHPTEWGGEDNVVPPPAMGRRRGGPRYAGSC